MNTKFLPEYGLRVFKDGVIMNQKGRILKHCMDTYGYQRVFFSLSCGKRKNMAVHRLLCIAFLPNPENKPWVNHIDGNKSNHALDNLEWCTPQENQDHAVENNLYARSKRSPERQTRNKGIKFLAASGQFTRNQIGEMFGMTGVAITIIVNDSSKLKYEIAV